MCVGALIRPTISHVFLSVVNIFLGKKMNPIESSIPAQLSSHTVISGDDLLIYISNQSDLFAAYGEESVRKAICNALLHRLEMLGISTNHVSFVVSSVGEYVAVSLSEVEHADPVSDDLFLERVKAALSRLPIACGQSMAFMNVFVTLGAVGKFRKQLFGDSRDGLQPWSVTQASLESMLRKHVAYRDDMDTAVNFFEQIHAGTIVLAFQPVVMADHGRENIYSECLLRRLAAGDGRLESCEMEIQALERLGLIDRLDRSILWAMIETLEDNPEVRLGCNISALSLRHDGWWRMLQKYLAENPDVATRLTLEITETSAISQSDEAANLLLSLRLMGCRIGLDDMGAGYSTVNFLVKMRPGIVKIDSTFVTHAHRLTQPPDLLRHLIAMCTELSSCVVVEGIESEEELLVAVNAGAHGVQGYLIERPTILPGWLKKPVSVQDAFALGHRCMVTSESLPAQSHWWAKDGS